MDQINLERLLRLNVHCTHSNHEDLILQGVV